MQMCAKILLVDTGGAVQPPFVAKIRSGDRHGHWHGWLRRKYCEGNIHDD